MASSIMESVRESRVRPITKERLAQILFDMKGAKIVGVTTKTQPKMRKTDNPYLDRVFKITQYNAVLNADYTKSVNRQRDKEGLETDFVALPNWQVPVNRDDGTRTPLVRKSDGTKTYLQMKVEKTSSIIVDENGRPYQEDDLARIRSFFPTQSESRQGVEKEVVIRTVDLDNVKEFRFDKTEYMIS
jgi:hypothetical protein